MSQRDERAEMYFRVLAAFWLIFGLITTFYPKLMELFMTEAGKNAGTAFSDNVWLHDGLDILAVALLLLVLSTIPATARSLLAAAVVALAPVVAITYSLIATDFYSPLFLVPAAASLGLAVYGFMLARGRDSQPAVASAPI